jgi:mannitol/fructose-specific phosphotransferase system IIA component (Ntr-type)
MRGVRAVFTRGEIDAWASQRILGLPSKRLKVYHEKSRLGTRQILAGDAVIPGLLRPDHITLALTSKTKASAIRDMVAMADRTGLTFDARELLESVEAREALCSTAVPGGLALLHARHHAAFRFEKSFMVLGRTIQPVHFGAPDGNPSRLFFLICCEDEHLHLHALARLCLMAMKTDVIGRLLEAPDAAAMYDALMTSEQTVLLGKKPLPEVEE